MAIRQFAEQNPADLVTAFCRGPEPDISPAPAYMQVAKVAKIRNLDPAKVNALVDRHVGRAFLGALGPDKVIVLKLIVALDNPK